jgi:hypothetical protein
MLGRKYSSSKLFHFYSRTAHRGYLSFLSLDPTAQLPSQIQSGYLSTGREIEGINKHTEKTEKIEKVESEGLAARGRMIR